MYTVDLYLRVRLSTRWLSVPGTRKNSSPAAAQLHLVMSVSGGGAHKVKVKGEHANDYCTLQMGPWFAGARARREPADDRAPARPPHPHGDARAVCSSRE